MAEQKCSACGKQQPGFFTPTLTNVTFQEVRGKVFCSDCALKFVQEVVAAIQVTTTPSLDGSFVKRYLGVESVEIVIGTGMFSEFSSSVADFLGTRSSAFEQKLQGAKRAALDKLRWVASERGGNAVVGIDLDYTEFSGNRIGLIANGTIVEVAPIQELLRS